MNKHTIKIISVLLTVTTIMTVFLSGCTSPFGKSANGSSKSGLNIVATIFPPYDFAREITDGTDAQLTMLLPPGAEAHSYDPSAQNLRSILDCNVFIYVGGENEQWVENIINSMDDSMREEITFIKLIDCVDLYKEDGSTGSAVSSDGTTTTPAAGSAGTATTPAADSAETTTTPAADSAGNATTPAATQENTDTSDWDEHVWTSPINAIKITNTISTALQSVDKKNASKIQKNTEDYLNELTALDTDFRTMIASSKRNTVVFADRFPIRYFTEEYGLQYFSAFPGCSSNSEASASTVTFLIDKVKSENIPVVFYIEMSDQKMADTICQETGATKLLFHSCHTISAEDFDGGQTYLSLMKKNYENLKTALN